MTTPSFFHRQGCEMLKDSIQDHDDIDQPPPYESISHLNASIAEVTPSYRTQAEFCAEDDGGAAVGHGSEKEDLSLEEAFEEELEEEKEPDLSTLFGGSMQATLDVLLLRMATGYSLPRKGKVVLKELLNNKRNDYLYHPYRSADARAKSARLCLSNDDAGEGPSSPRSYKKPVVSSSTERHDEDGITLGSDHNNSVGSTTSFAGKGDAPMAVDDWMDSEDDTTSFLKRYTPRSFQHRSWSLACPDYSSFGFGKYVDSSTERCFSSPNHHMSPFRASTERVMVDSNALILGNDNTDSVKDDWNGHELERSTEEEVAHQARLKRVRKGKAPLYKAERDVHPRRRRPPYSDNNIEDDFFLSSASLSSNRRSLLERYRMMSSFEEEAGGDGNDEGRFSRPPFLAERQSGPRNEMNEKSQELRRGFGIDDI